jgi:hypothetical protein
MAPETYASASATETSASSQLGPVENYTEDNDGRAVFVQAHISDGDYSQLAIRLPQFDVKCVVPVYIIMVGLSLSRGVLIFHLFVLGMTPKLRNLSSVKLTSLSFSLLIMSCAHHSMRHQQGPLKHNHAFACLEE